MKTEALNCRCCGGVLKIDSALAVCEYCGATNFVSDTAGKYITQLNRANKLRQEKEYDNAIRIYDNILSENVPSADILWLRTLCEYGIEYVPDPISSKYFPTLHRVKDESILNYHSYLEALALCNDEQQKILAEEAFEINRIQSEYLEIAKNEKPYDVFICYKETDEDTKTTTEDVTYCTKLYDLLTSKGYKVFFARETLKDKLSVDYEPYIFAALKSSKVMAVIGSKSEYFTATWVKNEWSRFLKLMEKDTSKQIFFACDDPEELPRAFSLKQAQLLSDPNAMEILARNIVNYLTNILNSKNGRISSTPGIKYTPGSPQELYSDAVIKLKQGNYPAVLSDISDLLEINPSMAEAYWVRLEANLRHNDDNIIYLRRDLTKEDDYNKAVELANPVLKEKYERIKDKCLENLRLQNEFDQHLDAFADAYEKSMKSGSLYASKDVLIKELEDLHDKYDNRILLKIKGGEIEYEINKRVLKLDSIFKTFLNDLQSQGISLYRKFCTEKKLSDRVELDMDSVKYNALRNELINEHRTLHNKYVITSGEIPGEHVKIDRKKMDVDSIPGYINSSLFK